MNDKLHFLTASDLKMDAAAIKRSFAGHVEYTQGKDEFTVSPLDFFTSTALSLRDRLLDRWNRTQQAHHASRRKWVYYLSLEYLPGRLLEDGLLAMGIRGETATALAELGLNLDAIIEREWDAGLGNGGLGRLAACFMDSMATQGLAAMGYGIRYEYGIFRQNLEKGAQVEVPDNWLRYGNPWLLPRPEQLHPVHFGGEAVSTTDAEGRVHHRWQGGELVMAMAYDVLVPGYRNGVVNTLRLWAAKASREFDLSYFNRGDYVASVQMKDASETISRVLYPSDEVIQGRELRLKQEYFFVSATLQDALRRQKHIHGTVRTLHEHAVFQLNDTHPAIAVAELMRLLLDEHGLGWDEAWQITSGSFAYTNHTVMPEALEKWPVSLLGNLLPRHLQIIYEINGRFLADVAERHPGDGERMRALSLIEEGPEKQVRMTNLAIVGSTSVNGVSALHSEILRQRLFPEFDAFFPGRFTNVTNGITPRRWLLKCNPALSDLLTEALGTDWVQDLERLQDLVPLAEDAAFRERWRAVKTRNKARLAKHLAAQCGVPLDPASLFDVQIKRIHEYKRQLLNVLHIVALYRQYQEQRPANAVPRSFLFSGKAAPGYWTAKQIIRLINAVATVVNGDRTVNRWLRVLFVPNYDVSTAERLIPAADLSEQISTAGTEASGTGNMKLSLNGALTLGTLDGANIEIREAVGAENFFAFGLDFEGASALRGLGYDPLSLYHHDPVLRDALDAIASGLFSPEEPRRFQPLIDGLLHGGDPFLVLADFTAYREAQQDVARIYRDAEEWTRRSILNVARMGRFSSDATIGVYAREIWHVQPGKPAGRRPSPAKGPSKATKAGAAKTTRAAKAGAAKAPPSAAQGKAGKPTGAGRGGSARAPKGTKR